MLLLDGPVVLGWQTWRSLEEKYGLGAIHALLSPPSRKDRSAATAIGPVSPPARHR